MPAPSLECPACNRKFPRLSDILQHFTKTSVKACQVARVRYKQELRQHGPRRNIPIRPGPLVHPSPAPDPPPAEAPQFPGDFYGQYSADDFPGFDDDDENENE